MHALLGSLHLFRDANPSRDQVDLVDTAEDCVTTLSDVINNVLDASKLAAKKIVLDETLNHLPTLFLRIRNVYQLSCRSQGLKFVFHELAPLPDYEVYCDHKSLTHLINNLLANALKAFRAYSCLALTLFTADDQEGGSDHDGKLVRRWRSDAAAPVARQ